MPRPPKPKEFRQNRETKGIGQVAGNVVAFQLPVPPPPRVLASLKQSWTAFWNSPMAQVIDRDTDLPVCVRLWTLYDERERAYRGYRKERMVTGSQGQLVLNPLGRQMLAFDAEIRQLEDRVGLSPMARLRLGITFGEAKKSMEAINAAAAAEAEDEYEDPRTLDIGEAESS